AGSVALRITVAGARAWARTLGVKPCQRPRSLGNFSDIKALEPICCRMFVCWAIYFLGGVGDMHKLGDVDRSANHDIAGKVGSGSPSRTGGNSLDYLNCRNRWQRIG